MRAGPAAEERALAELGTAGVALAVLGDIRRARPRGVEAADHTAVLPQHLTVDAGGQPADGEARIHGLSQRQIERGPRPIVLCCKVFRLFVELRILTLGCVCVIAVQGGGKIARRDSQCGLHLSDRLVPVDELDQREVGPLQMVLVDDEERGVVGLVHHETRRARVVGILGHEPPTEFVDDESGQQDRRRVDRGGDERLIHVFGGGPGRDAEADAQAVVVGVAQDERLLSEFRGVGGHHLRVHHEPARSDHHGAGSDGAGLGEPFPRHPDDASVLGHQVRRTGLVADLDAEFSGPLDQQVNHHGRALSVTGHRNLVAARSRHRHVLVWPHLLVAGVHQALGVGLDHRFVRVVGALEGDAEILEPVEVLDAALAVGPDLVVLGIQRHRDQILVHLLGSVGVAGGLLHRRTAAEIEVTAGQCSRSPGDGSAFQNEHPGTGCGRRHRRTAAADAEPDHHHVDVVGPFSDGLGLDGRGNLETAHDCPGADAW